MKRLLQISLTLLILFAIGRQSAAAILYESGTLGPTGVPWSDLTSGSVPNSSIDSTSFNGVRFHLNQPVLTSKIGGHFVSASSGTFFGAIVELEDEDDFPDSGDLSTPDVLGNTLLDFPIPSDEVFGDLALPLNPGWYALVFGSGLFGTSGDGAAVRNGTDINDPSYLSYQDGFGWFNLAGLQIPFDDHRFVITGSIVPEPTAMVLVLFASLPAKFARNRPQHQSTNNPAHEMGEPCAVEYGS